MVALIWIVIGVLVVLIIGGGLTWLVKTAPFVPEEMKGAIRWGIWAVIALGFLLWLAGAVTNHQYIPGLPVLPGR